MELDPLYSIDHSHVESALLQNLQLYRRDCSTTVYVESASASAVM